MDDLSRIEVLTYNLVNFDWAETKYLTLFFTVQQKCIPLKIYIYIYIYIYIFELIKKKLSSIKMIFRGPLHFQNNCAQTPIGFNYLKWL